MNTKKCGIYKIVNKINGKIYIGQSRNIANRWKGHIKETKRNNNRPLYCAMRKYGLDNFKFSVIVECDECMLDEFEIGIIQLYDTTNRNKGYNLTLGGSNGKHSEETKQKISRANKGKPSPNKGKITSKEQKLAISKANKGKPSPFKNKTHSNVSRKKMSASHKGSSPHNKGKTGYIQSDKTKAKISDATSGSRNPNAKKILYNGKIYGCQKELYIELGISQELFHYHFKKGKYGVEIE